MPMQSILVTGGAGFIGSHVVDLLLEKGYRVRILDKLVDQVHEGKGGKYVPAAAELLVGDIRNKNLMEKALIGMDAVIHLAAEVGVDQSMREIVRYVEGNTGGTAVMLELLSTRKYKVRRMVIASSMSVYGEGMYKCHNHGVLAPPPRPSEQLKHRAWETLCLSCHEPLGPVPTSEEKPLQPASIYAVSKMDQELMSLTIGRTYGISTVGLRFFNTYGPRQALSNPYTGVAGRFASRLLNGLPPIITEDGNQLRDFIHVSDTARAVIMALESQKVSDVVCNIGTGQPLSINNVALLIADELNIKIAPDITGTYRPGDIRHCWADTTQAQELLGFEAKMSFKQGVQGLIEWVKTQDSDFR